MTTSGFVCPGETHAISRAVHLARLSRGYSACARCARRDETGALPIAPRPISRKALSLPLFERERVWRSERDSCGAADLLHAAAAVADLFWDESPRTLPATDWDAWSARDPVAPQLCLGHDGSFRGRRLAADLSRLLMRLGCRLISIGFCSRPCLDFAVEHSGCATGLWVESGGSPAGVGFSLVSRGGVPWSMAGRLELIANRMERGLGRPARAAGSLQSFNAALPYRGALVPLFQDVRPLNIAVIGMPRFVAESWGSIAHLAACRLHPVEASVRFEGDEPTSGCIRPLLEAVARNRWDGGVIFGQDGRQLWGLDRREGLIPGRDLCRAAALETARTQPGLPLRVVAFESSMWMDLNVDRGRLSFCAETHESLLAEMGRQHALLGSDGAGRIWFAEPFPRCDALLTLAALMRHWSRTIVDLAA